MSRESNFEMKKLTFLYTFVVASHLTDVVLNNMLDFVEPNWPSIEAAIKMYFLNMSKIFSMLLQLRKRHFRHAE